MPTTGGCLCGAVKFEFDGEPTGYSACHCLPCQRTSGQSNSLNLTVPRGAFRFTQGAPRTFTRQGDSGRDVTYSFCGACPGVLRVAADLFPAVYILKWGTLDDRALLDAAYPQREIYTQHRFARIPAYADVPQAEGAS